MAGHEITGREGLGARHAPILLRRVAQETGWRLDRRCRRHRRVPRRTVIVPGDMSLAVRERGTRLAHKPSALIASAIAMIVVRPVVVAIVMIGAGVVLRRIVA